jgi:non-specific serine/threonine protein kinase
MDEQGVQQSQFKVLEGLTRLRQICCHPSLVDDEKNEAASGKLDRFLELVREVIEEGHRALVFSQFVQFLVVIEEVVQQEGWSYQYLDGSTRNREERVREFQQDPTIPLFLISLKAGGEGLNLTGADYVFLMDPWWNPAVEQQAMDRTHRIGQDQPVLVYRLICPGTIEEKMLELQEKKKTVAENVVTPEAGVFKDMGREELLDLFS